MSALPTPDGIAERVTTRGAGWDRHSLKKGAEDAYAAMREALLAYVKDLDDEIELAGHGDDRHTLTVCYAKRRMLEDLIARLGGAS